MLFAVILFLNLFYATQLLCSCFAASTTSAASRLSIFAPVFIPSNVSVQLSIQLDTYSVQGFSAFDVWRSGASFPRVVQLLGPQVYTYTSLRGAPLLYRFSPRTFVRVEPLRISAPLHHPLPPFVPETEQSTLQLQLLSALYQSQLNEVSKLMNLGGARSLTRFQMCQVLPQLDRLWSSRSLRITEELIKVRRNPVDLSAFAMEDLFAFDENGEFILESLVSNATPTPNLNTTYTFWWQQSSIHRIVNLPQPQSLYIMLNECTEFMDHNDSWQMSLDLTRFVWLLVEFGDYQTLSFLLFRIEWQGSYLLDISLMHWAYRLSKVSHNHEYIYSLLKRHQKIDR